MQTTEPQESPTTAQSEPPSIERWRHRLIVAWAVVGMVLVAILAVRGLVLVGQVVELLLIGAFLGFVSSPITNWFAKRLPRGIAAILAVIIVALCVVLVIGIFIGPFANQLIVFLVNLPLHLQAFEDTALGIWDSIQGFLEGFGISADLIQEVVTALTSSISSSGVAFAESAAETISTGLFGSISEFGEHMMTLFLGILMALWLAIDYPNFLHELRVIVGPRHEADLDMILASLSRSVGGYLRGTFITGIFQAALVWIGLSLTGHPYAALMAMGTLILHFIPVVGSALASAMATVLGLFGGIWTGVWALVITVVSENIAANVLSPIVMRSSVQIHPVLSIAGLVLGGCLGGLVGMILAIPVVAAAKCLFIYYFEKATGRQLVSEEGMLFDGTPYLDAAGAPDPMKDALGGHMPNENTNDKTGAQDEAAPTE